MSAHPRDECGRNAETGDAEEINHHKGNPERLDSLPAAVEPSVAGTEPVDMNFVESRHQEKREVRDLRKPKREERCNA